MLKIKMGMAAFIMGTAVIKMRMGKKLIVDGNNQSGMAVIQMGIGISMGIAIF